MSEPVPAPPKRYRRPENGRVVREQIAGLCPNCGEPYMPRVAEALCSDCIDSIAKAETIELSLWLDVWLYARF